VQAISAQIGKLGEDRTSPQDTDNGCFIWIFGPYKKLYKVLVLWYFLDSEFLLLAHFFHFVIFFQWIYHFSAALECCSRSAAFATSSLCGLAASRSPHLQQSKEVFHPTISRWLS
jgi:hypothetical protein